MVKSRLIPDDDTSIPRHFFIPIITTTPSSSSSTQPFCIPKAFLKYLKLGKTKIKKKKSHQNGGGGGGQVLEAILRSNGRGKSFHVNMIMDKDGRLISEHEQVQQQQLEDEDQNVKGSGGWKDFTDYHDLHVGDFLLFRHLGSLSFDVIVFDSTTCQRKYPPMDPPFFFFDHMITGKNSKKTPTPTPTPHKAKQADADADADGAASGSSNDDDTPSNQFTTTLKHYNFSQWTMSIPVEFVRSNGLLNKTCTITFRDEKGRSWPINLRHKKTRDNQTYVRGGWRQFIEGNDLKEGDVCTFELVSRRGGTKNIVFDVRRGLDFKTTTPDQAKRADVVDGAAAAGNSNENTPSNKFTTSLKYYNFSQWTMTIPAKFVRSNGLGNKPKPCTITFRDEKGRSWPINMRKDGGGQVKVHGGLRQFIEGNGLKEGDVCTFELVSQPAGTKNIVFDVYRGSKTTTSSSSDEAKQADANKNSASNKFTTCLKHHNFSKWRMVTIPVEFARSNGLGKKPCSITFRDEKGRSWPMKLRNYAGSQVTVNTGWRQFISDNGLKEGDFCTFELVSQRGGTKNIIFDFRRGHH